MSKELREANGAYISPEEFSRLLHWIGDPERKPPELAFTSGPARFLADVICLALKSERPADDEELVTPEWVRQLGQMSIRNGDDYIGIEFNPVTKEFDIHVQSDFPNDASCRLPSIKTRGDVRRLCRALGVTLKETT